MDTLIASKFNIEDRPLVNIINKLADILLESDIRIYALFVRDHFNNNVINRHMLIDMYYDLLDKLSSINYT